jgi:hypothetical protein
MKSQRRISIVLLFLVSFLWIPESLSQRLNIQFGEPKSSEYIDLQIYSDPIWNYSNYNKYCKARVSMGAFVQLPITGIQKAQLLFSRTYGQWGRGCRPPLEYEIMITGNILSFSLPSFPRVRNRIWLYYDWTGEITRIVRWPLGDNEDLDWGETWECNPYIILSGNASGVSVNDVDPGVIRIGTSRFVANVLTHPGQTSLQILSEALNQLESGGVEDVKIIEMDSLSTEGYGISFKVDTSDTFLEVQFDDLGINGSFGTGFIPEGDISGPVHIPEGANNVLYSSDLRYGFWDISNYDSTNFPDTTLAVIEWSNDSVVSVSTGENAGHFVLYYNKYINNCRLETVSSFHVYVDHPYPVMINSVNAINSDGNVSIVWSTSTESNNSGFEVQRSSMDQNWTTLGFVKGAGNSTEPKSYTYEDKNLSSGIYKYRLKQIDFNGNFEYFELPEAVTIGIPDKYFVDQNYPNPFNPATTIAFGIPDAGNVTLKIFDMAGREIKTLVNEFKDAGYYIAKFDGSSLASGTYIYRLESGSFVSAKKMILLK